MFPAHDGDLTTLYAETGVVLPDMVRRRFDEVGHFHRSIIENRRTHLNAEISSAEARIAGRDQRTAERDRRRRQIMSVLNSGAAPEHYTKLREEAGRPETEVKSLVRGSKPHSASRARRLSSISRVNLTKALRDDPHERDAILREVILASEALSEPLYKRKARPGFDSGRTGLACATNITLPGVKERLIIPMLADSRTMRGFQ